MFIFVGGNVYQCNAYRLPKLVMEVILLICFCICGQLIDVALCLGVIVIGWVFVFVIYIAIVA